MLNNILTWLVLITTALLVMVFFISLTIFQLSVFALIWLLGKFFKMIGE